MCLVSDRGHNSCRNLPEKTGLTFLQEWPVYLPLTCFWNRFFTFFFLIRKPALGFDYPGSPLPGRQDPSRKWLFHVPPKQHPGLKVEAGGLLSSCCTGAVTVSRMPKAPTPAQGDIPNWYLGERMQQVPFWKPPELNRPKTEQKERKKKSLHCISKSEEMKSWDWKGACLTQLSGLRTASAPPTVACYPRRMEQQQQQKPRPFFSNPACYKPWVEVARKLFPSLPFSMCILNTPHSTP